VIKSKNQAKMMLFAICMSHLIGILIGFAHYQRRSRLFMTTQLIKAIQVLLIIATVRSQILCQITTKVICGLKPLTFADSEVRTVRMPQVWKCKLAWSRPVARFWGLKGKIIC